MTDDVPRKLQHLRCLAVLVIHVHNEMIKDDASAVDALGSPFDELLATPFSIGEFFAEYVDDTVIPAEVDDNTTISK